MLSADARQIAGVFILLFNPPGDSRRAGTAEPKLPVDNFVCGSLDFPIFPIDKHTFLGAQKTDYTGRVDSTRDVTHGTLR